MNRIEILKKIEELAEKLKNDEEIVVKEAVERILSISRYLREYYESKA